MLNIIFANMLSYLQEHGLSILWKTLLAFLVFIVFYIVAKRVVARVRNNIEKNSLNTDVYAKRISKLIWSILFIVIMIFAILAVFQVIGFDVAILMWWISLWIWFAMENTIKNMIAGVMILFHKKIRLWEIVQLMWRLKLFGKVEEINVRYTVIKTFDRRRVIVPNSMLVNTPVKTLKTEPLLRWQIDFTLPRHVFIPQVRELMMKAIQGHQYVVHSEYASVLINWFSSAGIQISWFFFTDPKKKTPFLVWRDLKRQLFETFIKYGIKVPYPHTTLSTE